MSKVKITYNQVLEFKSKVTINKDIIDNLNTISENIKNIKGTSFTTIKTKSYIENNISSDKQLISLLNLLTDVNKVEICKKIINISFSESDIDLVIESIHKKFCLEYHFFDIYIYIIKEMILKGNYNFNNKLLWIKLVNKIQDTFNLIENLSDNEQNIDYHCGNILFIFNLCKEKMLSLSVINYIFEDILKNIDSILILINILFKTVEHIPITSIYNFSLINNLELLLKKDIPFRLKFKVEQVLSKIELESKKYTNKHEKTQKSSKNIEFEKMVISLIKEYKEDNSISNLEAKISKITNFRKSYFFKIFVLNTIQYELSKNNYISLINFIFIKKYKPGNHKNILNQILKIIKKMNNNKYIERFNLIRTLSYKDL